MTDHTAPFQPSGSAAPAVSVVIPNYNQTRYLPGAIRSALAQRHRALEVIVVDDGSSDDCRTVVGSFGADVAYIFQENQGLGGARNTGILAARGDLVGLLDADDEWTPDFLASMVALFRDDPLTSVGYCCAQAIDENGRALPRTFGGPPVAPDLIHHRLLRANFLIPSTVIMRRDAVMSVGLFDATLRARAGRPSAQGCEDWDLWLRLLPHHRFRGRPECLVLYRLHGGSLSANPEGMLRAAETVIQKNFGPDDGEWTAWTPEKRRAYGGVYRYRLLMNVRHGAPWTAAAEALGRALSIDASLAEDVDLFYELALGGQGLSQSAAEPVEALAGRVDRILSLVSEACSGSYGPTIAPLRRHLAGTALHGLGLAAYNAGHHSLGRRLLLRALRHRPALLSDRIVVGDVLKSFIRPWLGPMRTSS